MARGGKREGAGRKPGTVERGTLEKKMAREAIRQRVTARLPEIVDAQIENAKGVSYMVLRHEDGTFARATDEKQIDAACAAGAQAFQIFTQQPHQQSAALLLGYAADKPVEPVEHSGTDGGPLVVTWKPPTSA